MSKMLCISRLSRRSRNSMKLFEKRWKTEWRRNHSHIDKFIPKQNQFLLRILRSESPTFQLDVMERLLRFQKGYWKELEKARFEADYHLEYEQCQKEDQSATGQMYSRMERYFEHLEDDEDEREDHA